MTRRFSLLALVACILALTACQQSEKAQSEAPDPKNVVARVNGEPISEAALDAQMQALSARGQSADRSQALQNLITLNLLQQAALERGLAEQPEIAAELERQRAALLAQHMVRMELDNHEIDDAALREAYEKQVADAGGKEFKARHILVEKESEAQSLIRQLDDGADFAKLAEEHSTGPTGARGGDLGWFQANQMVEPFGEAIRKLEPGAYSETPVKTRFGWHVIRLEDTRDVEAPAFEQLEPQLRNQLANQHIREFLASLRADGTVEITDESLKPEAGSTAPAAEVTEQTESAEDSGEAEQ